MNTTTYYIILHDADFSNQLKLLAHNLILLNANSIEKAKPLCKILFPALCYAYNNHTFSMGDYYEKLANSIEVISELQSDGYYNVAYCLVFPDSRTSLEPYIV